ncbi:ubiquinol-cytochrome c reductase iron-sulfur subunit, partial [Pseudomonas floridensis]
MSNDGVNTGRRRFLVAATSVIGAAGAVGGAVPFVGSWAPNAQARGAGGPGKGNISKNEAGQQMGAGGRGPPGVIFSRTPGKIDNPRKA